MIRAAAGATTFPNIYDVRLLALEPFIHDGAGFESTHDPVLEDFGRYPRIHDYLMRHYVELEGGVGLVLVDARRTTNGRY